jgi:IrrE N-terminal-like domain
VTPGQLAESIIQGFAIRDPRDLDVEAISFDAGMRIEYRHLDGCAATLVGVADHAIATISPSGYRGRDRFSIGHELGHWSMHRGQSFVCRVEDFGSNSSSNKAREKEADSFASHLLLPNFLIKPAIGKLKVLSFKDLEGISETFATSVAATAFRITQLDNFPVILACCSAAGVLWSIRAKMVPARWQLKLHLDSDSFAHDLVNTGKRPRSPGKQSSEAWFANGDSDKYEIVEDCIPYISGQVLVLLYLEDEMLEAGSDRDAWTGRRR